MIETQAEIMTVLSVRELISMFDRVAQKNGYSTVTVLTNFIKDYIVSDGHPEKVSGSIFSESKE